MSNKTIMTFKEYFGNTDGYDDKTFKLFVEYYQNYNYTRQRQIAEEIRAEQEVDHEVTEQGNDISHLISGDY